MEKWPIGVFASIDAGLGVQLEVAHELGVPTFIFTPRTPESRTPGARAEFLARLDEFGSRSPASSAASRAKATPTSPPSRAPSAWCRPRRGPRAPGDERDRRLRPAAGRRRRSACTWASCRTTRRPDYERSARRHARRSATTAQRTARACIWKPARSRPTPCCEFIGDVRARQPVHQLRPGQHDSLRHGRTDRGAARRSAATSAAFTAKTASGPPSPARSGGQEVPLGEGDVGMENFLRTLAEIGYAGPLTIEREIPQDPSGKRPKSAAGSNCSSGSSKLDPKTTVPSRFRSGTADERGFTRIISDLE